MGPRTKHILRALTVAVLPRSEEFYLPIEDEIVAGVARLISALPPHFQIGFSVGVTMLEWCPIVVLGKPVRFSSLNVPERRRVVEKWLRSRVTPVREVMKLMSGLVALLFYDDPRVMHHIGYFIEDHIQQVNAYPPVPARFTVPLRGKKGAS